MPLVGQQYHYRGPKNGAFGKPCFCPLPKEGVLTKTAKMANWSSSQQKTRALLLRPRDNDENDENGGCHAGKGMVYQKRCFLFPDIRDDNIT